MITATFHKSGRGYKLSIPRAVYHALGLSPGQVVVFHHSAHGVVEMRNASRPITVPADPHPERAQPHALPPAPIETPPPPQDTK